MSAPSGKATIMIHLLKTHAVARKYYFAQDKCSYFFFLFLIKAAPVSVYKAQPYIFYSSAQMTLALPAPQQLLRVVNLLFCEERFNIYVAADIQTHQLIAAWWVRQWRERCGTAVARRASQRHLGHPRGYPKSSRGLHPAPLACRCVPKAIKYPSFFSDLLHGITKYAH